MTRIAVLALALAACGSNNPIEDLQANEYDFSQGSTDVDMGGVVCGTVECNAENSEICCIEPTYQFCASSEACTAGISLYCDGPGECAGGVCCQTSASTVSCAQTCAGSLVCHVDSDCPEATPYCCGAELQYTGSGHKICAATCS